MFRRLRDLRKAKHLTQKSAARDLGINWQYLSMIERGVRTPGLRLAKRMAEYYGISLDALFFADGPNEAFGGQSTNA